MIVRNRFRELLAQKERQEGRRIPYTEVAQKTEIHEGTLSRWASQVGRFDGETIAALCKYFECEIGDLLVLMPDNGDPSFSQKLAPVLAAA